MATQTGTAHKGKTALVTGACGGLGREIAESFLREGANVVVCDINKDLISDFESKVSTAYPDKTLVLQCDITSEPALDSLFASAEQKYGHLDYVINSAGMMDKFDAVGDMERSMWDRVLALNLTAPAMVSQRAVKMMVAKKVKGSIVNIASVAGVFGWTSGTAYTVSKHGLLGLTKNTAAFYGPKHGIRCNAAIVGSMHTNIAKDYMRGGLNMEGIELMNKNRCPDVPILPLEKVASVVLYLCSDAAEIVNGACWTVDGGITAA